MIQFPNIPELLFKVFCMKIHKFDKILKEKEDVLQKNSALLDKYHLFANFNYNL